MQYVVNTDEMRLADENTISYFGVPQLVLMERAALSARDFMMRRWPEIFAASARILIAVGNGNNGGDGAALARLFYLQGHRVTVLVSGKQEKYSAAFKKQMEILEQYQMAERQEDALAPGHGFLHMLTEDTWSRQEKASETEYDLVVDALFGIGLSRPIGGIDREKIAWLNGLSGRKAALDIPSGVSAKDGHVLGEAFRAELTVTFGFLKTGMLLYPGKELCGEIRAADIGITEESFLKRYPAGITLGRGIQKKGLIPLTNNLEFERKQNSHKGSFGKVLLFAGSAGMPGAALLAGEAVLRSGAGMVKLVSPAENRELILTKLPEAMYQELGPNTDWSGMLAWCDAVVIGPGIGQESQTAEILKSILTLMSDASLQKPLLLDADGLNLAAASEELSGRIRKYTASGGIVVMTPHMAELGRLLHCGIGELQEKRLEMAEQFVRENGVILVSKDAATIVCYADAETGFHYYINQTGNSGMATAGSGDVLSGMAGAFIAFTAVQLREQKEAYAENSGDFKKAYFEAACRAVYVHGEAGDRAAEKYGEISMKAGDMIGALPEIFAAEV